MPWAGSAGSQTFSRTNGFNTGSTLWQSDDAGSVNITSSRHDMHDQDISDGVNVCLKKDGGNTATANLPMGGFKLTNAGDATARTQYVSLGQVQDGDGVYYPTVGGTGDAITLSGGTAAITAYGAGQRFQFIAGSANTGATTVNVDTVGAKSIKRRDLTALSAGDIIASALVEITYDGTQFQLESAGYTVGGTDVAVADGGTGASPVNARLAVGAANRILRSDGTDPAWGQLANADVPDNTIGFAKLLTTDATN